MIYKQKIITLMTIFSFMSVGWGQDTTPPELTGFIFYPNEVDITQSDQDVNVSFSLSLISPFSPISTSL